MRRQITLTVKHEKEGVFEGWVKLNHDKITRPNRLEEFLGKGSVPSTDYKVRYSLKVDGELEVYTTGCVRKEGRSLGGVLCFLHDFPEWTGKRIHREIILDGKIIKSEEEGMLINPIVGMLHNQKLNRYHPILFAESPLPGDLSKRTLIRHRSKGHHTKGFETRFDAVKYIDEKLIPELDQVVEKRLEEDIPWDGENIPAMTIFSEGK